MPLAERTSWCILSHETDGHSFDQERCERESLSVSPVEPVVLLQSGMPLLHRTLELSIDGEFVWSSMQLFVELVQCFGLHPCCWFRNGNPKPRDAERFRALLLCTIEIGPQFGLSV
jgi:hypothetical protein